MKNCGNTTCGTLILLALLFAGCTAPIEGDVTINGSPLPDATVTLTGMSETTVLTDSSGHYVFPDRFVGKEYTIVPSMSGHLFTPVQRTVALTAGGLAGQDFAAAVDGVVQGSPRPSTDPQALIVTTQALEQAFEMFAVLHTTTGIPTEVVTVEEICNGACDDEDPTNDTAKAVKGFLMTQPNLAYALLGGDIEEVPSRQITDSFYFALTVLGIDVLVFEYTDLEFHTDYYYADFAEWDPDGDGVYAEENEETSDYRPEIAVARIPVSTVEELSVYYEKMKSYISDHDVPAMEKAILQAGVFTRFRHPISGDLLEISSAFYAMDSDRTLPLLSSAYDVTRQFESANPEPDPTADIYYDPQEFADLHIQLLQEGTHMIRYADHGTYTLLAPGIDVDAAYNLVNDTFPIIFSETCHGAEFGNGDTAGEQVVKAPQGGAVAYCGQGSIGSSLLGANQLMDETLRYAVTTPDPILADAYFYGHDVLPDVDDTFTFPLHLGGFPFFDITRQVITEDNCSYAQKASVMLGDFLIPVWNEPRERAPDLQVTRRETGSGIVLTLIPGDVLSSAPVVCADGTYYAFDTVGTSFELALDEEPLDLSVGFPSTLTQYFYAENVIPEPE